MVHKPIQGLTDKQKEVQDLKTENDFKCNTNKQLSFLQFAIDTINASLSECIARQGSYNVYWHNELEKADLKAKKHADACSNILDEQRKKLDSQSSEVKAKLGEFSEALVPKEEFYKVRDSLLEQILTMQMQNVAFRNEMKAMFFKANSDLTKAFEDFKKEISSKPSGIPELREELLAKINLVALDGTNSVLRTENFEKQLLFSEKKIEQAFLLIKKLELSK